MAGPLWPFVPLSPHQRRRDPAVRLGRPHSGSHAPLVAHVTSQFSHGSWYRFVSGGFVTYSSHNPLTRLPYSLLTPLFWAVIFWASNGKFHIEFVDSLFICVSAVTGTGLTTLDLSSLTAWQQTILVILEITGSPVTISWLVVMFRR